MINEGYAKKFCKDDISKIENYDKAMNDKTQTWHCHHRLELTLDGDFALSKADLIRMDMYYNRPYFELVFLTPKEHMKLHNTGKTLSAESKKKMAEARTGERNPFYGQSHKAETRYKISEAKKGEKNPNYGKKFSAETKQRMAEARRAYWANKKKSKQTI